MVPHAQGRYLEQPDGALEAEEDAIRGLQRQINQRTRDVGGALEDIAAEFTSHRQFDLHQVVELQDTKNQVAAEINRHIQGLAHLFAMSHDMDSRITGLGRP